MLLQAKQAASHRARSSSASEVMPRTLVWFRYDLRLSDNAVVAAAVKAAKQGHEVVPLFCFDDRFMKIDNVIDQRPGARKTGEPKMGKFRAQFLLESVNALKQALQGIGSDLFIYYDRPERVVPGVCLHVHLCMLHLPGTLRDYCTSPCTHAQSYLGAVTCEYTLCVHQECHTLSWQPKQPAPRRPTQRRRGRPRPHRHRGDQ